VIAVSNSIFVLYFLAIAISLEKNSEKTIQFYMNKIGKRQIWFIFMILNI